MDYHPMGKKRFTVVIFMTLLLGTLLFFGLLRGAFESRYTNKTQRIEISYNDGNSLKVLSENTYRFSENCEANSNKCVIFEDHIKSKWQEFEILVQAEQDDELRIALRGPKKNYPVAVDYKDFSVEGEELITDRQRRWYDFPYIHKMQVKKGQEVHIKVSARKHLFRFSDFEKIYGISFKLLLALTILVFLFSYRFVQYLAKFKIEEKHSRIDIVFLIVFFLLLILPMSNISTETRSSRENRMLAPKPSLLSRRGLNQKYGEQFEKWFNDHFLGRTPAISLKNAISNPLNSVSSNQKAFYIKKNGWMFNTWQILPPDYDAKEEEIIDNLRRFDAFCKENGIKLYVFIQPVKHLVYEQEMKEFYGSTLPPMEKIEKVINKLNENLGERVIFPYRELVEAKKKDYVFFKTSHHWTDWGAYVGYKALIERLQKDFPDIPLSSLNDYEKSYSKKVRDEWDREYLYGCTASLLGISKKKMLKDVLLTDYTYYDYKDKSAIKSEVTQCYGGKATKDFTYSKGKYKLFLTGNSQNENLLQFLPYSFHKIKYMRANTCVPGNQHYRLIKRFGEDILAFKPDILVINVHTEQISLFVDFFKD